MHQQMQTSRHSATDDLETENSRLRADLEWRTKDQMRVEGDLLAVMAEWREKVAALEDRLEDMAYRHRVEKEELTGKMRGMYSSEVVSKLQRDLANALNLRESALSEDIDARDVVIQELGTHLRQAHESNQRMHLELQDLQTKYHEEVASGRARETRLKESIVELQEALRSAEQKSVPSFEAQRLQQLSEQLQRELVQAKGDLADNNMEKDRIKRESEWAVSKMNTELQRAQHALAAFEDEIRQSKVSKDGMQQHVLRANDAKMARLSSDLDLEKQRTASLEQQMDVMQQELKRKSVEISQLQASLTAAHSGVSSHISGDDTMLVSSPTRRRRASISNSSPLPPGFLEQQQKQEQERSSSMMASEIAALRSQLATLDRECIELHSALDAQKSKERIMVESLQSKDTKVATLEGDVNSLREQVTTSKERELRTLQELKESKFNMEDERVRLLHTIKDLERDRESAAVNRNETYHLAEIRSKLMDVRDGELRALQDEYDRALSEWKATKHEYVTKISEANARAGTAQEAILLLEADLEMKNKLLDQVVESSGGGSETLNIYGKRLIQG